MLNKSLIIEIMDKKFSTSTLDSQQNVNAESTVDRRELNKRIEKLEQADKQSTNTINQLRAVNEAMRKELRFFRLKNPEMKVWLSNFLTEADEHTLN